jgi:hypothetical protein
MSEEKGIDDKPMQEGGGAEIRLGKGSRDSELLCNGHTGQGRDDDDEIHAIAMERKEKRKKVAVSRSRSKIHSGYIKFCVWRNPPTGVGDHLTGQGNSRHKQPSFKKKRGINVSTTRPRSRHWRRDTPPLYP